ncbi:cardiolipin synthase [Hahella ganghwensis]|uniref:cardiolipin synthase n=1 Tax=Hahella ganghwensis TaxID=286420 RepID=UPI0003691627|nr:cardiolipin synthase [Hahella ganghwensis]
MPAIENLQIDFAFFASLFGLMLVWMNFMLVIVFAGRVIMKRLPVGASLSWLIVLLLFPYVGVGLYILFGERYLGSKRRRRQEKQLSSYQQVKMDGEALQVRILDRIHDGGQALANYELSATGLPAIGGNTVAFLNSADDTIRAMVEDIDQATEFCHLEFYIWHPGGQADQVAEALVRAKERGVVCRVMLDAVGSQTFFRSSLARLLRKHQIRVIKACPIRFIPWRLARYDLRNHRKMVVIDGRVSYIGSFNLIDPRFFKQDQGVGEWIDVMARIEGPSVKVFDGVYRWYWNIEAGEHLALSPQDIEPDDRAAVIQAAPSGPDVEKESILNSLLQAIYSARQEILIVTPYFVPGEVLSQALRIAARRGVKVSLILPKRVDSFLVRYASRSYFEELLQVGVNIYQYDKGLLHTKCVLIDGRLSFFGTVNMDLRSLWLNFEMTLIVYDAQTTGVLQSIVEGYIADSALLDPAAWEQRSLRKRFVENVMHLFSPLI